MRRRAGKNATSRGAWGEWEWFRCSSAINSERFRESTEQPRHLNHGCVKNVEQELRRDANGKHQQRRRNDSQSFPLSKVRQRAAVIRERSAKKQLHRSRKNNRRDEQTNHRHCREDRRQGKRPFENQKLADEPVESRQTQRRERS